MIYLESGYYSGYLFNTKTGALVYNLFHHRGIALILVGTGFFSGQQIWMSAGILLFAHASFDRMPGFGLKYEDAFKHTHPGTM